MIRPDHPTLSIVRQCRLVSISRSSFYHDAQGREPGEPGADGGDRPAVPGDAVLRRPADDVAPARGRAAGERQAGAPPDAADGPDADLPAAADQRSRPRGTRLYPYLLRGIRDRAAQPGVVRRHHLHPAGQGLPVPGGDHGLVEPQGAGVAAVEHHGRAVLHRGAGGGARPPWPAGDLQHRPGQPVHRRGPGRSG